MSGRVFGMSGEEKRMLGKVVTDTPFMSAELLCYNESDNLAINQLSVVWSHYLLKRKVKSAKAVEKLRFEFLLRHIGRVSDRTVETVTAPLYEVCRGICGWWKNEQMTDSMTKTWQQTMWSKLDEYNRGVSQEKQVKTRSDWRLNHAEELEKIYRQYANKPRAAPSSEHFPSQL